MHDKAIPPRPDVSLITSWFVRVHDENVSKKSPNDSRVELPGLELALAEGVDLVDLYLLDHGEIPVYTRAAGLPEKPRRRKADKDKTGATPVEFLCSLDEKHIRKIAIHLRKTASSSFVGRGVGRRPRFAAIATYFPQISLPHGLDKITQNERDGMIKHRDCSIKALQSALYLAEELGCHCVEAVAGTRIPQPSENVPIQSTELHTWSPNEYREERINSLVTAIQEVFEGGENRLPGFPIESSHPPYIALELEPGPSYLLNDVKSFYEVWLRLPTEIQKRVGLNADLAHFFLLGIACPNDLINDPATGAAWYYKSPNGQTMQADATVLTELKSLIVHMHISDHSGDYRSGGVHSSDLIPGEYHKFASFEPWLEFACNPPRISRSMFSGTVAVELEANCQVADFLAARSTVRRWIRDIVKREKLDSPEEILADVHTGAIAVIDLGNSTREFYSYLAQKDPESGELRAALAIQTVVGKLCDLVRDAGGSVMSFTGDGVVALFEDDLLPRQAARCALTFATDASEAVSRTLFEIQQATSRQLKAARRAPDADKDSVEGMRRRMTIRTGLHWGQCYVPTMGSLTDKAISRDVVYAARVCAWLSDTIEPATAQRPDIPGVPARTIFIGCTSDFRERLKDQYDIAGDDVDRGADLIWSPYGEQELQGLSAKNLWVAQT